MEQRSRYQPNSLCVILSVHIYFLDTRCRLKKHESVLGEFASAISSRRPLGEVEIDGSRSLTAAEEAENTSSCRHLIPSLFLSLSCLPSIWEKCQENNNCTKGQRRTNRPFQAFITFAAGYSRGARPTALTFGLFLHRVESHMAVVPNNVRGKKLSGQPARVFSATVQRQKTRDSYC